MSKMAVDLMQMSVTAMIVAGVALLLIVAIILLLARSSGNRRVREARMRARLIEMEREAQFAAAADRVPHSRKAGELASHIARLFNEYLSIRVLAVYAGRENEPQLINILSTDLTAPSPPSALPATIPATLLPPGARPGLARLSAMMGFTTEPQPAAQVEEDPTQPPTENLGVDPGAEGFQPGEHEVPQSGADEVLLVPWNAAFQWRGIIVASIAPATPADAIEPYREPLARLAEKLGVALELESEGASRDAVEQRASRTAEFARSLIECLEDPLPLGAMMREVTKLVGSDSAALWRLDDATSMISMVACEGLRSAEFLPLPLGQGLAGNVASSGETLAVVDAPSDPRCIFPREARESGIVSYLGAPLSVDGKLLGVIEAHSATRRDWTQHDHRALESAAAIVAEMIKSTETRGNRLRIESAYLGLSEALQRLRSADELKEAVVEVLGHALSASRVVIVEFGEEGQPEAVKQEHLQPPAKSALGAKFAGTLAARVAAQAAPEPIAIADSREQSLMGAEQARELEVLSELALPIRIDGRTQSIVYVHQCDRPREWVREEIDFAERVARQLSLSLSNLRALDQAFKDAEQARAELNQARTELARANAAGGSTREGELERKIQSLERVLEESRNLEEQARGMLAKASALEAKSRAEAEIARHAEAELRKEVTRRDADLARAQNSAQQLLEINRLKSEFIVNAGREIEASLQSVLGMAELLVRGSYGALTSEQLEAVNGLYGWARRIKNDVDWLIEYGSTRSRRLESSQT